MTKILLVEDDPKLSSLMLNAISGAGFSAEAVASPGEMDAALGNGAVDLLVLDRILGSFDTKAKIPEIKRQRPHLPILIISAINTPTERADLINDGADDYLGKPFLTEEFLARVRSLARRSPLAKNISRKLGLAELHLEDRKISVGPRTENLPAKEFLLLKVLSEFPGKVISRHDLLAAVWGDINYAEKNLVEATVTNLRRRLTGLGCGFEIRNQRNTGYWIEG